MKREEFVEEIEKEFEGKYKHILWEHIIVQDVLIYLFNESNILKEKLEFIKPNELHYTKTKDEKGKTYEDWHFPPDLTRQISLKNKEISHCLFNLNYEECNIEFLNYLNNNFNNIKGYKSKWDVYIPTNRYSIEEDCRGSGNFSISRNPTGDTNKNIKLYHCVRHICDLEILDEISKYRYCYKFKIEFIVNKTTQHIVFKLLDWRCDG